MNILERIIKTKKAEIQAKKGLFSSSFLEQSPLFNRSTLSISKALKKSSSGIIAEHKRRSPSKAVINQSHQLLDVISAYQANGATAPQDAAEGVGKAAEAAPASQKIWL